MPVSIQKRFEYLGKKIETGKASKFEEHVYRRCEKALEFCNYFLKEQKITDEIIPLEIITHGKVRMLLNRVAITEINSSFLPKLKDAGYIKEKECVIPPIEPYLLNDIKSPYVKAANKIFKEIEPKIINNFEDVDWDGIWRSFPKAEIRFEDGKKEGLLTFKYDKFLDFDVIVGKPFSMKSQNVKDFSRQVEEYENLHLK